MEYFVLVVIGLACGSFVNALVWRMHEQESSKKKANDPKLSILKGRSMCPDCKHELSTKDLIPVLSWLSANGKCRYCKKPVSWQYPVVELATAALFVHSYVRWPEDLSAMGSEVIYFAIWILMLIGLVALFVYDLRWMILPNRIVFPLIGLAIFARSYDFFEDGQDADTLQMAILGALLLGGLFYTIFAVSKGRWIGGGDVKLGIFIGILLGPILSYLVLLLASLLGSVVILSLIGLKIIKRNQQVPFGPFLIAATYIAMLCGQRIVDWYSSNFLGGLL